MIAVLVPIPTIKDEGLDTQIRIVVRVRIAMAVGLDRVSQIAIPAPTATQLDEAGAAAAFPIKTQGRDPIHTDGEEDLGIQTQIVAQEVIPMEVAPVQVSQIATVARGQIPQAAGAAALDIPTKIAAKGLIPITADAGNEELCFQYCG